MSFLNSLYGLWLWAKWNTVSIYLAVKLSTVIYILSVLDKENKPMD